MRQLQARTVDALYVEVRRVRGDEASARSELSQFQQSKPYRRGLIKEFIRKFHRQPKWHDLVRFWFVFTIHRSRIFRMSSEEDGPEVEPPAQPPLYRLHSTGHSTRLVFSVTIAG